MQGAPDRVAAAIDAAIHHGQRLRLVEAGLVG
jgi:hypothetical protein